VKDIRRHAVRALLLVARWWGLGLATARRAAGARDAELDAWRERALRAESESELLRARLRRMEPKARSRYTPWQRLAILWHGARHGLSARALARIFVVAPGTIARWLEGVRDGARRLVRGREPVNKLAGLIREVVARIKMECPSFGSRKIAGCLARLGLAGSRASVQRILRRPPPRPARLGRAPKPARRPRGLRPRRPGHMYFIDFTRVRALGLFGLVIGAVVDAFSRKVLAISAWRSEPSARDARELLARAIEAGGKPRHLVSDRGVQFTARVFTGYLSRRGIRHRYGAVARSQSVAIVDRFFGSLKSELAGPMMVFKPLARVRSELCSFARWFNTERGHWSLASRTPAEVFAGRAPGKRTNPKDGARFILAVERLGGLRSPPVFRLRRAG
jgi:transposase InsO family protein